MNQPKCEATKSGVQVPEPGSAAFEAWRNSIDPDTMGFDGMEVDASELQD